jgi:hypothetical protein
MRSVVGALRLWGGGGGLPQRSYPADGNLADDQPPMLQWDFGSAGDTYSWWEWWLMFVILSYHVTLGISWNRFHITCWLDLVSTRQVSTFLQKIKHIATDMAMNDKSKLPDAMSNWKNIAGAAFFPRHRICMKVAESFEQDNEGLHCFCTGSGSCYAPHITAPWWWGLSHTHSFNVNVSHLSELCR